MLIIEMKAIELANKMLIMINEDENHVELKHKFHLISFQYLINKFSY